MGLLRLGLGVHHAPITVSLDDHLHQFTGQLNIKDKIKMMRLRAVK